MAGVRCRGEAFGEEVVFTPCPGSCDQRIIGTTAAVSQGPGDVCFLKHRVHENLGVDVIATIATTVSHWMRKPYAGMPPITSGSMVRG